MADDSRHRKFHQDEHQDGGVDEIGEGTLLPQDPTSHASSHEEGGSDELNLDATQIGDGSVSNTEFEYLDGVSAPVADEDYVDSKVQGLDWQESVLDMQSTPPSSPSTGDRYIVDSGGADDWDGHDEEIAEWDGSDWEYTEPNEGFTTWVEDENTNYVYNDEYDTGDWVTMSGTQDHGSLSGLGDDDHTQYLLVDGSRSMSGSLDMGDHNITSVGDVDGIDISAHDHDGDAPNIPNAGLDNSSITVSSGDHMTGGGSVSLGDSTTLSFDGSNVGWGDLDIDETDVEMSHISPANANLDMDGNDIEDNGDTIYDASNTYIPLSILEEDTVTVNTGNGLSGGSSLTLGDSTTLEVDESDIDHDSLSGGTTDDAHHNAFIGLEDDSGSTVSPDGNYRIQISTDNTIDADAGTNEITLSTTSEAGVTDHGNLDGLSDDDHTQYLLADGSRAMNGDLNLDSNNIDNVAEIDPSTFLPTVYSQDSEPSMSSGEFAIWEDTGNDQFWLIHYDGSDRRMVEIT